MSSLSSPEGAAEAPVCVTNIGARGRRLRMTAGVIGLLLAIALLAMLWALDASRWWRLLVFLPSAMAGTGFLQAKHKTCIALARTHQRETEHGLQSVDSDSERKQIQKQARRVEWEALAFAVLFTVIALLLPPIP